MLLSAMGRSDEAIALLREAVAQPDAPDRELMLASCSGRR